MIVLAPACNGPDRPPELGLRRPRVDVTHLATMNVALYAPPTPVGDVWLRELGGTSETGEWVDLNFTPFQVSESGVTNAFRPRQLIAALRSLRAFPVASRARAR